MDHIDHDPGNNVLSNLRYVISTVNNINAYSSIAGEFRLIPYDEVKPLTYRLRKYGKHNFTDVYYDSDEHILMIDIRETLRILHPHLSSNN